MKRSLPDARVCGRATYKWIGNLSMAWGLLLSVMVIGCAGSLDPGVGGGGASGGGGGTGGGSGDGCQVAIFSQQCSGCHGTGTTGSAGLDLTSPNPEQRLLNKMTGASGSCMGMTLLVPNTNPAQGVFIDKITMTTPPCGSSMPLGSSLNAADKACLTTWANGITMAASP